MDDIKKVDTTKYNKEGKVNVDGKIWSIKLPGAGKELRLSKAQRRLKFLQKKIDSGNYDESDLDAYDNLEDFTYNFFYEMFQDGTEDNSEVKAWMDDTPLAIIVQSFEDIKSQASEN